MCVGEGRRGGGSGSDVPDGMDFWSNPGLVNKARFEVESEDTRSWSKVRRSWLTAIGVSLSDTEGKHDIPLFKHKYFSLCNVAFSHGSWDSRRSEMCHGLQSNLI